MPLYYPLWHITCPNVTYLMVTLYSPTLLYRTAVYRIRPSLILVRPVSTIWPVSMIRPIPTPPGIARDDAPIWGSPARSGPHLGPCLPKSLALNYSRAQAMQEDVRASRTVNTGSRAVPAGIILSLPDLLKTTADRQWSVRSCASTRAKELRAALLRWWGGISLDP